MNIKPRITQRSKPRMTQRSRHIRLSCPECDQNLGAWETFVVDGSGPDRAGPTLDALMRRGVRIDTPETGSVTFLCTNAPCVWQGILSRADLESIIASAAWEGARSVRLTHADIEAGREMQEVHSLDLQQWIEPRTSDGQQVGNMPTTSQPRLKIAMANLAAEQVASIQGQGTRTS